jgi:hypothetical protein
MESNRIEGRIADGKLPWSVKRYGGLAKADAHRISSPRVHLLGNRGRGLRPDSSTEPEKNQQWDAKALYHGGTSLRVGSHYANYTY